MKAVFEKVNLDEHQSIFAFYDDREEFDAPWHFHPEFELTYIKSSSGIRYVGDDVANFGPQELVLLGASLPHCWKNTEDQRSRAQSIVVQWRDFLSPKVPELTPLKELLKRSERGLLFPSKISNAVLPMLQELLTARPMKKYLILMEILDLLSGSSAEYLSGESYLYDHSSETGLRLDKIQSFVKQHYQRKITLEELASITNMTEQSFSRFYSKTMGRPFFEFLNEYRVNMASRMLIESDKQVAEVGYLCGYETLPFFYKQFKKFKGYTPLAFRKLYIH